MIPLPKHKMTAEEFLAWAEGLPKEAGRFELWDGEVIVKRGPSGFENAERAQHWKVKGAIYRALHDAVVRAGLPCFAVLDGASVRLAEDRLVEPDALVYCGAEVPPSFLEVSNPVVVVGVLSPTTRRFDLGDKLQGYFSVPSLHHYLVIDPERGRPVRYKRGCGDIIELHLINGPRLGLDPPGLDVDLAEGLA
jgi:Uma2 family endonuclease